MVGLDFKSAPLGVRGQASLSGDRLRLLLTTLRQEGISECAALSTCNRTEIYFSGGDSRIVELALCEVCDICLEDIRPYLAASNGMCVACHLFRVCAGLESAVIGETEIVAQVKEAWRIASEVGANGPGLDVLLQRALEAGKRVRSETDLCRSVTSTGTLAVREAKQLSGDLKDKMVIIVGAGRIAQRIAKELYEAGANHVLVLNRTPANAGIVASACAGTVAGLDELEPALQSADVVFATASVPSPLITAQMLRETMAQRGGRPLTVIDMGVPPNVQRSAEIVGLAFVDIDELSLISSDNERRRNSCVQAAMKIVSEELAKFKATLLKRSAGPTISSLIRKAEVIRSECVAYAIERKPELRGDEIKFLEEITKRLVKGILEAPLAELNGEMAVEGHRRLVERLFHLNGEEAQYP